MQWIYNDGGRKNYYKGAARDCAARAMAIALSRDYQECYKELAMQAKRSSGVCSARNGIKKSDFNAVLIRYGFIWHPAPAFADRKARCADLTGTVIARQAKHFVAVIDGVAFDTFNSTHKMVYGYWGRPEQHKP